MVKMLFGSIDQQYLQSFRSWSANCLRFYSFKNAIALINFEKLWFGLRRVLRFKDITIFTNLSNSLGLISPSGFPKLINRVLSLMGSSGLSNLIRRWYNGRLLIASFPINTYNYKVGNNAARKHRLTKL